MFCSNIASNIRLAPFYRGGETIKLGMCFPAHTGVFSGCNTKNLQQATGVSHEYIYYRTAAMGYVEGACNKTTDAFQLLLAKRLIWLRFITTNVSAGDGLSSTFAALLGVSWRAAAAAVGLDW